MSNGATATRTRVGVPAGGTSRASLVIPSIHVCQLARSITFASARSFVEPTADNKAALGDLLTRLRIGGTQNRLLVSGHTDLVGGRTANQRLSERRTQAVQAILQGDPAGTAVWETLFNLEVWGDPELTAMITEVGETDISRFRGGANRTARLDLFRRYFERLLGGSTVPAITATIPPLLACGQDQPLRGSRSSPSRDPSLPAIGGEFRPNRRSEFFFFDSASTPITCSEYPKWTVACSLTPPATTVTVTIAPVQSVRTGATVDVQVTVNPSTLPFGTQVNLTLSNTGGTGEARFGTNNGNTLTITGSGVVAIRGVTASSAVDNIRLSATVLGQAAVLAQEDFTVVAAISIFLQFEVFNLTTRVFEPLPAGINVDLMDEDPARNDLVATRPVQAGGRVFFNLPDLAASGEPNPDIFFLVHTNGIRHAGHTLPNEWSTNGWNATDGTPGLRRGFTGPSLGTPTTPIVFRVGLDLHAEIKYHADAGHRRGNDDPAPKGVLVKFMQERPGPDLELIALRTNDLGRVDAVVFNAAPGSTFYLKVVFEIEDSSINLKRTRVSIVKDVPPILDVITPAGATLEWDSNDTDNDRKVFPGHRITSIGTASSPELFLCKLNDRNVALHILKVLREEAVFFFQMTGGDWNGVEVAVTPTAPVTAFSWPPGRIQLRFPDDRWDRETVTHEMAHQVMWETVNVGGLGILYQISLGNLVLSHTANLKATQTQALIEGWAEFVETIFEGVRTPPFSVSSLIDTSGNPVPGGLGPPPNDRGESVEGAFANGLWAIFQNHVVTSGVATNAHVPESVNGDIVATTPYLRNTAVRDRFLSMIWNPLKDLRPLLTPTSTNMLNNIRSRNLPPNLSVWHILQPELQTFNMAMTVPTITAISPTGGLPAGGTRVTITGTDFTLTNTSVTIGGTPATAVTVSSHTSLTAVTPAGALGPADVVVTTLPGASAPLAGGFLYARAPVVSSVTMTGLPPGTPARGPMGQDTPITIRGADFQPDAHVLIGGEPATAVVNISPTEITARSPRRRLPLSPGGVPVVVRNPDLQEGILDPGFEYFLLPAPVLVDVIPDTGSFLASTPIGITGANFQPSDVLVFFDRIPSVPIPVVINRATSSATVINAVTPGVPAPVSMDVRVENPDGQFNIKPGGFTYTP